MNNNFIHDNNSIGTDPTLIETIDSLDVLPGGTSENPNDKKKKYKTKDPDKKGNDIIKKIIFVVVIIALMAGVAFGLYYYLSLGTKKKNTVNFTLDNISIGVNEELSKNVIDYGNFSTVDISTCSLNINDVNVSEVGTYNYSVTCKSTTRTAQIIVENNSTIEGETLLVFKNTGDTVEAKEFINSDREYEISFENEDEVKSALNMSGGPYLVNLKLSENGSEKSVSSALYVMKSTPKMFLSCTSNIIDDKYTITDKMAFDDDGNDLNVKVRIYTYSYPEDYESKVSEIVDGKITIDDHEGIALTNSNDRTISIVNLLSQTTLNSEYGSSFPDKYNPINNYYRTTKNYTCSIK